MQKSILKVENNNLTYSTLFSPLRILVYFILLFYYSLQLLFVCDAKDINRDLYRTILSAALDGKSQNQCIMFNALSSRVFTFRKMHLIN